MDWCPHKKRGIWRKKPRGRTKRAAMCEAGGSRRAVGRKPESSRDRLQPPEAGRESWKGPSLGTSSRSNLANALISDPCPPEL